MIGIPVAILWNLVLFTISVLWPTTSLRSKDLVKNCDTAQEQLIVTSKDRNQAAVATSLQVFFNLNCLPEIVLLAIDSTIRSFVAVTENAIELDSFASAHAELINSVSGYPMQAAGSASLLSSTAAPIKAKKGNFSQMRVAMREISYNWTSHIHEHAMQINVLQRVIAKKETLPLTKSSPKY